MVISYRCNGRQRKKACSDEKAWYCRICKNTQTFRRGSFFSKSKLTLQQWLIVIFWRVHEYPVTKAATAADVAEDTACDIFQWLREVCSTKLLQMSITLGGPGIVVQIDESQFKHKPKV